MTLLDEGYEKKTIEKEMSKFDFEQVFAGNRSRTLKVKMFRFLESGKYQLQSSYYEWIM